MPKMKTRKSTAKRFKVTGTGKIARSHANKGHLLTGKTRKRKRNLRRGDLVNKVDEGRIRRQLGLR
jgi:large subunit ribosomal protein L35